MKDPKDFHFYEACELCGYKIKYLNYMNRTSEKNYHLLSAHFKSKLEKELGQEIAKSLPNCPIENCELSTTGKFSRSSQLLRHIGGATHVEKLGLLAKWFHEEIESKNEKREEKHDDEIENVEEISDVIGKKYAFKKYDQFTLNTSCFWGSTVLFKSIGQYF